MVTTSAGRTWDRRLRRCQFAGEFLEEGGVAMLAGEGFFEHESQGVVVLPVM
jgi:hypothetical protein